MCVAGLALAPVVVVAQTPEIASQTSTIQPGTFALPELAIPTSQLPEVPAAMPETPAAPEAPVVPEAPAAVPEAAPTAAGPVPAGAAVVPGAAPERVTITADKTISTGVAAIVNDFVISNYDLDQRVNLFLATSGVRATPETLAQIRAQVLRSVEDEILELQEAAKHKITVTKADVDKALQNISMENHVPIEQILNTIMMAGVSVDTFRAQVGAQLLWQKVVAARYGTDILVNDQQVNEAMERLRKGADKPQFLVSEIFIAVDRPEDEDAVGTSAKQIADQLTQGAPFATVAGQFSQSPSAADGGDIGWVVQGQLADDIDQALLKLRPGQTTAPIRSEGGYYVLLLRDRREPIGTMIEETPQAGIGDPEVPIPLDRLLIPLVNPEPLVKERATQLGINIRSNVRVCADLSTVANQIQGSQYSKLGQVKPIDLDEGLRERLLKTEAGKVVEPFFSSVGLEIIMRCDTPPQKLVAFTLPSRNELEQQLFVQQMTVLAKSYLRDLRRNAVVETR